MGHKYEVDLSILIVNWNVKELLRNCLNSIYKKTQGITFEIIVVDNASYDNSLEMIRGEFPEVKLLASSENLGFSRANNLGFPLAQGKYIALLNPDTVLLNDAFEMMFSKLESEPEIGVVGPRILGPDGTVWKSCARRFITLWSELQWMLNSSSNQRLAPSLSNYFSSEEYSISQVVDCISGACMVIRREVLTEECIFDPQFFMYAEDVDLCYEAVQCGWKVFYLAEAQVIHFAGSSANLDPISTGMYTIQTKHHFFVKRYGKLTGNLYRCFCVMIFTAKFGVTWLIRLNPRLRHDPLLLQRSLVYPVIIRWAIFIGG